MNICKLYESVINDLFSQINLPTQKKDKLIKHLYFYLNEKDERIFTKSENVNKLENHYLAIDRNRPKSKIEVGDRFPDCLKSNLKGFYGADSEWFEKFVKDNINTGLSQKSATIMKSKSNNNTNTTLKRKRQPPEIYDNDINLNRPKKNGYEVSDKRNTNSNSKISVNYTTEKKKLNDIDENMITSSKNTDIYDSSYVDEEVKEITCPLKLSTKKFHNDVDFISGFCQKNIKCDEEGDKAIFKVELIGAIGRIQGNEYFLPKCFSTLEFS